MANVLIGVAVVGAGIVAFRDRALRRRAWTLARTAAAASWPWLLAETKRAWEASGHAREPGERAL
jgi:hypothetical protein